jgi:hypothetical protein
MGIAMSIGCVFLPLSHLGTVAMGSLTSFLQRFSLLLLLLVATVLVLATCDVGVRPDIANLQVRITDDPSDVIVSAEVCVSEAFLQERDADGVVKGHIDLPLAAGSPWCYDLMTVRDGLSAHLVDLMQVRAGNYSELTLVVRKATITLGQGFEFEDGRNTAVLHPPAAYSNGIQVRLERRLALDEGTITDLLVDFDVDENFLLQRSHQRNIIDRVIFTPTLTEKGRTREDI